MPDHSPSSSIRRLPLRLRVDEILDRLVQITAHGIVPFVLAHVCTFLGFTAGQWRAASPSIAVALFALAVLVAFAVLALQARAGIRYERAIDHRDDTALDLSRARFTLLRIQHERDDLDRKAARLEALRVSIEHLRREHAAGGVSEGPALARVFDLLDTHKAR